MQTALKPPAAARAEAYDAFCVHYLDLGVKPPARRMTRSFVSLEGALDAARRLADEARGRPTHIRGVDGTVLERERLEAALARSA